MSLTPEQKSERATGVGASEAAQALGMSKYGTGFELFLKKTGQLEPEDNPLQFAIGHALEPVILSEHERIHGVMLERSPQMLRNGIQLCHLDAWLPGQYEVQAKTRSGNRGDYGDPGSDEVPQDVMIQVQQEMALARVEVAYVPVIFFGSQYVEYVVEADHELQDLIRNGVHEFWQYVERGEPPPPDFDHPTTAPLLKRLYRGTNGDTVWADESLNHWAKVAQEAAQKAGEYGKMADYAKNHLLSAMGEAALLQLDDGMTFRRKQIARKGYTVEPSTYIDARFMAAKEK